MRNDRSPREQWSKIECALLMFKSVCPVVRISEEEGTRAFTRLFILPGKVIRVKWHKSFSLDENSKTSTAKIIPTPDNKFENINHHVI